MDGGSLERERLVEIQKTGKLTTDSQRRQPAEREGVARNEVVPST
jgi:hypothetical protein